ncbi:DUF2442 domain-containing protein [Prosthecobacter sp.]|uniref:DUF2442 domain-containing protein n=1 Tax=Prosthecobacter sp. TaxID=1965333 RepID=UPI003784B305
MSTTTLDTLPSLQECRVTTLRVNGDHLLAVRFRDGLVAELDFGDDVQTDHGPMAEPLRDPAYFATATIEDGTVTWPNGYNIDPVTLHTWASQGYVK